MRKCRFKNTSKRRISAGTLSPVSMDMISPGTSFSARKSIHCPSRKLNEKIDKKYTKCTLKKIIVNSKEIFRVESLEKLKAFRQLINCLLQTGPLL